MKNKALYLENNNDPGLCCGCRACEQACAKKAISMKENSEGFLYPVIDESRCVDCGACATVCPFVNADKIKQEPKQVYAAINRNLKDRKNSSSGGVFSALAKNVLEKKGVVYGAAFDENLVLSHQRVDDEKDFPKLMGSKYVQSDLNDVFLRVKKDLTNGLVVLFSGTPCQVAGLKLFLKKDYEKLMTVDIVCHGTPSLKIFRVFVNELEKDLGLKVVDYKFRDKRVNGWSCLNSCSCVTENENGKKRDVFYNRIMNAYSEAFLTGDMNRECCYKCPYADRKRVGDFTLADYWRVYKIFPKIDYSNGVSMFAINTEKGTSFVNSESIHIDLVESDYAVAAEIGNNAQMLRPGVRSCNRDSIYARAFDNPEKFVSSYFKKNEFKRKIMFSLKRIVRSNDLIYMFLRNIKKRFL